MAMTTLNGHGATPGDPDKGYPHLPPLIVVCPKCGGTGTVSGSSLGAAPCRVCNGVGEVLTPAGRQVAEVVRRVQKGEL